MDELVAMLRTLGVPQELIERAAERGDPEGAIFDAALLANAGDRVVTPAEIEARGGLTVAQTRAMMATFGFQPPEADDPAFTEEEAHALLELGALGDVWPFDLNVQIGRVYGRLLARIAQTEVQLFRLYSQPRLGTPGPDGQPDLARVQAAFARLLAVTDPLIAGVHHRWLEHEFAQAAVRAAESDAADPLPGTVDVTLLFCDLKDFTAYAEREGDEAAVAAIDSFFEVVVEARGDFRFMKTLGDGVMLAYSDPVEAVRAGSAIVDALRGATTPGVHASAHRGQAVAREGDYFGGAVNVAARLLAAAGRDELVVTAPVVDAAAGEFAFAPAGSVRMRGVAAPIDVFRLA